MGVLTLKVCKLIKHGLIGLGPRLCPDYSYREVILSIVDSGDQSLM
jgi:hypothetical protein